jgi:uncharacterized protein
MTGLSPDLQRQIIDIITGYKDVEKVVIFGSRAGEQFQKTSDIDLAVFAKDWTDKDVNLAKDLLEENIKTPLKIDLLNFYLVSKDKLKRNIIQDGEVIYEARKN